MVFNGIISYYQDRAAAKAARIHSQQIDETLRQDALSRRKEATFLALGRNTRAIMKSMKLFTSGFSDEDRVAWKDLIIRYLEIQFASLKTLSQDPVVVPDPNPDNFVLLASALEAVKHAEKHKPIKTSNLQMFGSCIAKSITAPNEVHLSQPLLAYDMKPQISREEYNSRKFRYLKNIDRIFDAKYLPSDGDTMMLPETYRPITHGPHTLKFSHGSLNMSLIDIDGLRGERRKWIHMFEGVNSVLMMIDLAEYDQMIDPSQTRTLLEDAIADFDSIVNSRWFVRSFPILIMTNYRLFKSKLETSPLSSFLAGFDDNQDSTKAVEYIFQKFWDVNSHGRKKIYPFVCELDLPSNDQASRFVIDALLEESIVICYCFGSESMGPEPPRKIVFETLT